MASVFVFLGFATILAILQNVLSVIVAKLFWGNPLLGIICGSLSQTGGYGTALGFAVTLIQALYTSAATTGAAAATYSLVCGGLIGAPIAVRLIRQKQLLPHRQSAAREIEALHEEAEMIDLTN